MDFPAINADAGGKLKIILYSQNHWIVQPYFVQRSFSLWRSGNSFRLFHQFLPFQFQLFVTDMRLHDVLPAFRSDTYLKPKKLWIAFSDIDYPCFLWRYLQPQPLGYPCRYSLFRSQSVLFILAENSEIICISHDIHFFQPCFPHFEECLAPVKSNRVSDFPLIPVFLYKRVVLPLALNPFVQFIQHDIGKQRWNDTALRSAFVWNECSAVWHSNRCFQNPLDNKNQLLVVYSHCPYLPH